MIKCQICGKVSAGRKPKGGDGSVRYPRYHNAAGKLCPGSRQEGVWVSDMIAAVSKALETPEAPKLPPLCDECGKDYADPPSKLCPACEAYREHTA